MKLPKQQVAGSFPVNTAPAAIVRIPAQAAAPGMVSVWNDDPGTVVYLKWVPLSMAGASFNTSDASKVLQPKSGFTWDSPPLEQALMAATVTGSCQINVDAAWAVEEETEELGAIS